MLSLSRPLNDTVIVHPPQYRGFIEKLIERVAVAEGGRTEATELAEYFEKQTNKLRAKNHKLETERMEERSREVGSKVVETVVSHGVASVI